MTNSVIADQLLPEAWNLCKRAVSILGRFCWKIVQNSITLAELQEIDRCEGNVEDSMQQFYRIDFKEGTLPKWDDFMVSLQRRFKEYQKYEERRKQLYCLAAHCHEFAPGELWDYSMH